MGKSNSSSIGCVGYFLLLTIAVGIWAAVWMLYISDTAISSRVDEVIEKAPTIKVEYNNE